MALDVHLVTPEREVWAGSAEMVIARGSDGMVGILAGHAPLLIRLSIAPIRIQLEDGSRLVAVVDGGFLHVTNTEDSTRVDVLASFAELSDDIDRVAAQARVEQAQARLAQGDDAGVRAELMKALARTGLTSSLAGPGSWA
jgi:F-type H+-transporting ATPase subunit epsilon